ncbi:Uroporphyrinogen decarboxylase in heme biosynthesis [Dissophora globulifera]|nr:Uroporphyrinogen decarboxylase in heme biosynthesis [Dissophora globulifera]
MVYNAHRLAAVVVASLVLLFAIPDCVSGLVLPTQAEQRPFFFRHSCPRTPSSSPSSFEMTSKHFPKLKNDLLLRAARGEKTERAPVWIMRQAGRYLPEYRKVRAQHDFFEICRTPELATEVTLQPVNRFDGLLDAAIIFSDILIVPQVLGLEVEMVPGKGPQIPHPLVSPKDLDRLKEKVDVHKELQYLFDAITMTRHALNGRVPLIGFVGGPWTLMSYMVEGSSTKQWAKVKTWIFKYPEASHDLLQKITDVCVDLLVGQARAGAQMLQVFDSWSGELSPRDFEEFALYYLAQIADRVKSELGVDAVPMTVFAKNSWYALEALSTSGYDVVSLDWTQSPTYARSVTKGRVTMQGNLDPNVLLAGQDVVVEETETMVREFYSGDKSTRYIANLGHGIMQNVPVENVEAFLKTVHRVSRQIVKGDSGEDEEHAIA